MPGKTDQLIIELKTDGSGKVKASIAGVGKELGSLEKNTKSVGQSLLSFKSIIGGIAFGAITKGIIETNVEYQKLSASLKTVTGSADAANIAFKGLEEFASTTPFQIEEVVGSFIKLKALGLDPSLEALESYGNTASAMGKDLNQLIEAVADAATGEFERLKEFGIKASSEGENVSFTFRGVTTTVRKEAGAIEGYLRNIGETDFSSGMADQIDTLGGRFSNFQDSVGTLSRTIGDAGLNDLIKDITAEITELNTAIVGFVKNPISMPEWMKITAFSAAQLVELFGEVGKSIVDLGSILNVEVSTGMFDDINAILEEREQRLTAMSKRLEGYVAHLNGIGGQLSNPLDGGGAGEGTGAGTTPTPARPDPFKAPTRQLAPVIDEQPLDDMDRALDLVIGQFDELDEEYARSIAGLKEVEKEGVDSFASLEAAARGWGDAFTNTLADMVQKGKLDFSALVDSIISDLLRIAIYQNITAPLFSSLGFEGFGAAKAHSGGIVGSHVNSSNVSPLAFAGAQRYHSGGMVGLGPNEVPIIANKGEEVLTENDPRHRNNAGGGAVKVEIIKNGSPINTSKAEGSFDADGMVVRLFLDDMDRGGPMSTRIDSKIRNG